MRGRHTISQFRIMWLIPVLLHGSHAQAPPRTSMAGSGVALEDLFRTVAKKANEALVPVVAMTPKGGVVVGTGFFVGGGGEFVTAGHVLTAQYPGSSGLKVLLRVPDGKPELNSFDLVDRDTESDIALCRLRQAQAGGDAVSAKPVFSILRLSLRELAPGSFVTLGGFSLGSPRAVFSFGTVASFRAPGQPILLNLMINDGESGSPVIDVRSGTVVGIAVSVRTTDFYAVGPAGHLYAQQNSGIAVAVPVGSIAPLLSRHGITFEKAAE